MATKKKATSGVAARCKTGCQAAEWPCASGRSTGTAEARDTARLLLEIEAIHCRPDNPYIFTSGRASPVYIDCRKIISFPEARAKIMQHAFKAIERDIGWNKIDVVAGGETAGIPFAAFLAALAKKPMIYVRKQPKGFGRMAQIEGDLKPEQARAAGRGSRDRRRQQAGLHRCAEQGRGQGHRLLRDLPLRHLPAEHRDAGRRAA